MRFVPKRIIVDTASINDEITERIISALGAEKVTIVKSEEINPSHYDRSTLILTHNNGRFVKDFDCSQADGWNEKYVVSIINCPFNCSYCYLQAYFKFKTIVIYTNTDRMKSEVTEEIASGKRIRITTGEFSDSLALDHLTGTTSLLTPLFNTKNAKLELRTKTSTLTVLTRLAADIKQKAKRIPNGTQTQTSKEMKNSKSNIVVTWTLSPEKAIKIEEPGTASLNERLEALGKASSMNLDVAIRFDPIIPFYYNKQTYNEILSEISKQIPESRLDRIELGILRFPSNLIEMIGLTKPDSNLLKGEFIKNREGKYVLIRPLRLKIFREIVELIRIYFPKVHIKLSMEDEETRKLLIS